MSRAAEYFSTYFAMPPVTARALAWLMIADPPEQSGAEIAAAIGASRASITSTLRVLLATGLVSRRSRRGDRTVFYVIDDRAWEEVLSRRIKSMAEFTDIADAVIGELEAVGGSADRIRAARCVFAWFTDLTAPLDAESPAEDSR
jgi:DNA-binding MarR family transcriptional regulator